MSAVGQPLYADSLIKLCKVLSFCVEIDVDSILPSSVDLKLASGQSDEIVVFC